MFLAFITDRRINSFYFAMFLCLFFLKGYLFIWKSYRQTKSERDLPCAGSIPKKPQQLELGQVEARNQDLLSSLPPGQRCWSTLAIFHCFPTHLSGTWFGKGAASAHMRCWHCRQQLNLLHCNAGLICLTFLYYYLLLNQITISYSTG